MTTLEAKSEYLLLGKVTGSLSPEEEKELLVLLAEYPAIQQQYEELLNELPEGLINSQFGKYKNAQQWKELPLRAASRNMPATRTISLYVRWAAAVLIVSVCAGGWYWWSGSQLQEENRITLSPNGKPAVQLKLANGQLYDLSASQGAIRLGDAEANNADKSLSYHTSGTSLGINRLTVPIGMDYKVLLEDGSEVLLNSASTLEFPFTFSGPYREITISGEAFVTVAKDAARPFKVHLPETIVDVLGTSFNVNTYDSGIVKVALVDGAVQMKSSRGGDIRLTPGNEGVCQSEKVIRQQTFDPKFVLSWRKGLFYFDKATLSDIIKVLPRWFGVQVVIDDPGVGGKKFVGVLDRNKSIDVFLDDLRAISKVKGYFDKNNVLHFK